LPNALVSLQSYVTFPLAELISQPNTARTKTKEKKRESTISEEDVKKKLGQSI